MTYQILVSTMHQTDDNKYNEMNLNSDAIIVNQSDNYSIKMIDKNGYQLKFYTLNERGVGLSRNTAMMRADADIIQFADDDMIFSKTYREDVLREFDSHPEADAILFSINSLNPERSLLKIKKFRRVRKIEALKYGCARLAIRRECVIYNNITFSLLFGGGAKYSSGEDTLFLQDCIRAGLKIYKSPVKVADVKQDASTWFSGYTEKYYKDKGALFAASLPILCWFYALISAIKSSSQNYRKSQIFSFFIRGIKEYKTKQKISNSCQLIKKGRT